MGVFSSLPPSTQMSIYFNFSKLTIHPPTEYSSFIFLDVFCCCRFNLFPAHPAVGAAKGFSRRSNPDVKASHHFCIQVDAFDVLEGGCFVLRTEMRDGTKPRSK